MYWGDATTPLFTSFTGAELKMYVYTYKIVEQVCSSYSQKDFLGFTDECESDSELTEISVGIVEIVAIEKSFFGVMELLVDTELKFGLKSILVDVDEG